MNFELTTEYAIAGMIILPLFVGIIVWIVKDKQLQKLNEQLLTEQNRHEADQRVTEEKISALKAAIANEKRVADEHIKGLKMAEESMTEHFKALSGDILRNNSDTFRKQGEQSFTSMIKPIAEALKKTEKQIQNIEKDRRESFGSIAEQIKQMTESHQQLQKETRNLVTALRRPEVRGQWGELTLRRIAELAGMVEYCDFSEQVSADDNRMRPDMVVHMPDKRELVVDAKTPLDAYLSAIETEDVKQRDELMAQHARHVRNRVNELSQKKYWSQFKQSPDYVVLFIPGEQFLSAALEQDGKLLEDALQNRVVLATPTTIIALLRAVAFGWRQMEVAENAEKIQQLGEDLYGRVATFVDHISKLGKSLNNSVDSYNKAIGSLERNVLPGARKFEELGIQSKKTISETQTLEVMPRSADHLVGTEPSDKDK